MPSERESRGTYSPIVVSGMGDQGERCQRFSTPARVYHQLHVVVLDQDEPFWMDGELVTDLSRDVLDRVGYAHSGIAVDLFGEDGYPAVFEIQVLEAADPVETVP